MTDRNGGCHGHSTIGLLFEAQCFLGSKFNLIGFFVKRTRHCNKRPSDWNNTWQDERAGSSLKIQTDHDIDIFDWRSPYNPKMRQRRDRNTTPWNPTKRSQASISIEAYNFEGGVNSIEAYNFEGGVKNRVCPKSRCTPAKTNEWEGHPRARMNKFPSYKIAFDSKGRMIILLLNCLSESIPQTTPRSIMQKVSNAFLAAPDRNHLVLGYSSFESWKSP